MAVSALDRTHSVVSSLHLEDTIAEPRLNHNAYTAVPSDVMFENASDTWDPTKPKHPYDYQLEEIENQSPSKTHATLRRSASYVWGIVMLDTIISLIPLFFLAIAIICLCLHKKPTSLDGQHVKAITLLSPTIFPIVYAAILGKLLRRIALYKAERSSTIGTLEQLTGSQSFFSSMERQIGMRRLNMLGIAILLAWLLSPLGGQSSLRLLSTQPIVERLDVAMRYQSIEGFVNHTLLDRHMLERHWAQYAPLYMTSIQTSHQVFDQPRDLFGNIRIPDISTVITSSNARDRSQWHNISEQPGFNYTSLLGVPLVDVPQYGNVSFTLESSYWEVSCEKFVPDETERLIIGPTGASFFMDFDINSQAAGRNEMHFDYVTKTNDGNETMPMTNKHSKCLALLRLVESDVGCEAGDCKVQKMRYLDHDTSHMFHGNTTIDRDNWSYLFRYLTDFMPGADLGPDESGADTSSEIIELWMADPSGALGDPLKSPEYNFVNLGNLPTEVFSSRLQMAMNTFWDSTLSLAYRSGNMTTRDLEARNEADSAAWATTRAVGTVFNGEEYVCDNTFAALTIIISGLLFVAASVSIVLGILTKAPDILGYVSTLGRDDSYFGRHIPSHLDGLEAARLLRDVRVIVGDVRKGAPVGHVAFASMDASPGRVSKERFYD